MAVLDFKGMERGESTEGWGFPDGKGATGESPPYLHTDDEGC